MRELTVETERHREVRDITDHIDETLEADYSGLVTVFTTHTTTGIVVNEAEPRLLSDFETALDELVANTGWQHDELDGNADAHIRAMLIGSDVTVPVVDGSLALGTWQAVLFFECDGPRSRTVTVHKH